jgi:predicted ATP-grasp superfamily ATP-dependent carboligase
VIDTRVPVVVVCRGAYGAVSIARTLGRLGVSMYFIVHDGVSTPGWSSRYWLEKHRWDFSRPEEESVRFLLDFGEHIERRHGRQAVLLTLADWVAIFVERNAARLTEQYVCPLPVRPVLHTVLNKWGMHQLAREQRIPTPITINPNSLDEANEFLRTSGLPVVMKAADPFVPDRPPTKVINSRQEMLDELEWRAATQLPLNVVLQEFIPGGIDSVWMCNGYFGANPGDTVTFTGQKLRQVSAAGVASLAVCTPNETVAMQTQQFMEGIGYRGCVGIGWRYDRRDQQYKVLDVNARVSGVFRLFAGTNDIDVVRACYLRLTGQPVPPTALQPGRKWMLEDDLIAALSAITGGRLTVTEWVRSLRGVRELHWLAADDPLPALVWLRDRIRRVGSYAAKRMTRAG